MTKSAITLALLAGTVFGSGCAVVSPSQPAGAPVHSNGSSHANDDDESADVGGFLVDALFWAITGDDHSDDCCCKKCCKKH